VVSRNLARTKDKLKSTERREELNILGAYLQEHGLKHSQQREAILQHFLDTSGHMTVDDLYRGIHRKHPGIGRTTIYRALKLFVDAQLASAIELKDGLTRFEHQYRHAHHDHMICTECGTILEFLSPEIEKLQDEIAEAYGFSIESHRHQIFGQCQKCTRAKTAPARGKKARG
jgi:Fur family ferric uptake transcriptional regulator